MREFDLILQGFQISTKLDIYLLLTLNLAKKMQQKNAIFNEIYAPIFDKKKFSLPMKEWYFNFLTP